MMSLIRCIPAVAAFALTGVTVSHGEEWPHYAGDRARTSIASRAPRGLDGIRWSASPVPDEEYVGRSGPLVAAGRVIVNARLFANDVHVSNLVIAYDVFDGMRLWSTPIEADIWDSWSSPAVDERNQNILLGSGYNVYALDVASGEIAWRTALEREIVNASPVVTDDLGSGGTPSNRAFITDFNGFGDATLYALNVDPFDAVENPYEPGDIVWTAALPGASGNSPAYDGGVVYVTSTSGVVKALHATDGSVIWETDVGAEGYPEYSNFSGGITVRHGRVYAASYEFSGSGNNSGLFKLEAATGEIVWVAPCERTYAIPVVSDDGQVYLSAGIEGFGSTVKIQAFRDHGESVSQLWDTYVDTDGELIVGGWTHQPAYARGYLYVGTPPPEDGFEFFGPYIDAYVLDTSRAPGDPQFIVAHHAGSGGTPALGDGTLYTFGSDGLFVFDPSPACLADLNGDGTVALSDLSTLLAAYGTQRGDPGFDSDADLDRDGRIGLSDLSALLAAYGATCP